MTIKHDDFEKFVNGLNYVSKSNERLEKLIKKTKRKEKNMDSINFEDWSPTTTTISFDVSFVLTKSNIKLALEWLGQKVILDSKIAEDKFFDYEDIVEKEGIQVKDTEGNPERVFINDTLIKTSKGEIFLKPYGKSQDDSIQLLNEEKEKMMRCTRCGRELTNTGDSVFNGLCSECNSMENIINVGGNIWAPNLEIQSKEDQLYNKLVESYSSALDATKLLFSEGYGLDIAEDVFELASGLRAVADQIKSSKLGE